ncbi:hypothetical protein [Streptomyces sp. URMC 123]|uniref:hypothetical protein n=1 Tax=Streptomyces sp. URMC 123 TaxID=3423403 RepID=UPI003F1C15D0
METPTVRDVLHQGRLLTLVNRREISARRGLIVSGPWAMGTSTGKDMSDHLKYFAEHIPATFVYAGINVQR